jgi:hypothetical protein
MGNSFFNDYANKGFDDTVNKRKKLSKKDKTAGTVASFDFTEVFVWGDDTCGQLGLYHQKVKKGTQDQKSFKVPKTCSFNILIK